MKGRRWYVIMTIILFVCIVLNIFCGFFYTAEKRKIRNQAITQGYAEYWCPDPSKEYVEFRWKTPEEIGVRCVGEFIPVTVDMEDQK